MPKLSIVIVAFSNMDCLKTCLDSIPQLSWIEVIVVNNTHQNRGFGAGNNLGFKMVQGEFVLFLNPDCIVTEAALKQYVAVMEEDPTIGILGPRLTDIHGVPYSSCNEVPTRTTAPIVYSGLNKLFSTSSMVKKYWYNHKAPEKQTEVGSVSGASLMLRKADFEKAGGFDERFFLYWEELDLAMRLRKMGKRIVFDASISLIHEGELSTVQPRSQVMRWFRESRVYFFRKYFGLWYSTLLEGWLTLFEEWRLVVAGAGLLGIGYFFFQSGWWLLPGQVWLLQSMPVLLSLPVSYAYWLGVAGSLMGMIAFYNETSVRGKWLSVILSFLVGLCFMLAVPANWLILVGCGLLWVTFDIWWQAKWLRQLSLALAFVITVLTVVLTIEKDMRFTGFVAPQQQWKSVAQVLRRAGANHSFSLRCIGCTLPEELIPLEWQLKQYGFTIQDKGIELYIILPPYSLSRTLLPNTASVSIGSMKVAWPFEKL